MPKDMKQWNKIYKKNKTYGASLDYLPRFIKLLKKQNTEKILDLGCGGGKHVVYFAKHGFNVYGIDISIEAIKTAKKELKKNKVKAILKISSISQKLPYKNNFFNAVVSLRVMNHGKIEQIRKTIKEIERVLRPKGLIFVIVQRIITKKQTEERLINSIKVKMIDSHTYFPLQGREKGIIHYIFNKKSLLKEFKNFKIQKIWVNYGKEKWERYYYLLAELKIKK